MISTETAKRLVQYPGDLKPGEALYRSPTIDWTNFDMSAYWELREDGTAYDWHPSEHSPTPWSDRTQ